MAAPGSPGQDPSGPLTTRWTALTAVATFYLDAATLISVAIALPVWRSVHQLSVWQVGMISGGLAVAVAAGALGGGWVADRLGRDRIFTYDLMLFALGSLVVTVATGGPALIAGVLLLGVAIGTDIPVALSVITGTAPGRRSQLTAATQVGWTLAVLVTFGLGIAVSAQGLLGTRLLMAHLLVLSTATLAARLLLTTRAVPAAGAAASRSHRHPVPARQLLTTPALRRAVLLVGGFYLFWNTASTTIGAYLTYILVTVTGLDQRLATTVTVATVVPALLMAVLFTRLAATQWRDRLFVVALVGQIAAFGTGAVTGAGTLGAMLAVAVLYSLTSVFAGEAIYKVWAQLLYPDSLRATALGLSYGTARLASAAFLLIVPLLIQISPTLLMVLLTACVTVSGGLGLIITRHRAFMPRLRAADHRP